MSLLNPWKSYRQVATQTAPPATLVLMLYDGALRFLEVAMTGFEKEDPAESNLTIHNNVQRAQEIVRELDCSLNLADGGEVAANLRRLYHYFDHRLYESNLRKQPEGIREVIGRLTVLRNAWSQMLANQRGEGVASAPELAVA
jgi:flagellar secretion chaperone FliS